MTDIPEELVEKAAEVILDLDRQHIRSTDVEDFAAERYARAVLAAVLPDVRRAAVDRDALAEALCQRHQQASPTRIPCAACSQDAADLAVRDDDPQEARTWQQEANDYGYRLQAAHLEDVKAERDALAATVERVRALHSQETSLLAPGEWCPACGDETPCRTIRALDGEEARDR